MRFFLLVLILSISHNLRGQNAGDDAAFSQEALQRHVRFLGNDIFEGRGTGTMGGNLAAKYLALELNKLNLIPLGDNSTYYQNIPMHGSTPLPSSKLIINNGEVNTSLKLWDDYVLFRSGEQTFIPNPVQLVFVGYGIAAPEFDYNDYQSVDINGKIAVMIEGEPTSSDVNYFNGENPTVYSFSEAKQRIAISRGARGCVIIPGLSHDWSSAKKGFLFEDITLAFSVAGNFSMLVNPEKAKVLFDGSPFSLDEIYRMHIQNRITSFPLNTSLSFRGEFTERDFVSPNLIGMIKGSDPDLNDSYLLISAHYDHLGIGPAVNGDSIYNGVFDNAIGCAALLEIARAFTQLSIQPKRSIIFLLLTGEEKGLLGSSYYTENPVVPLYKTIANVNIDGIALFAKFKSIVGVGAEYSSLHDFLIETADSMNLTLASIPPQFEQLESFNRSDQVSFANAGIPSILISEGPDYENYSREKSLEMFINYSMNYYHSPFDDLNQQMNFDAAAEHIKVIYNFCTLLADSETEPEWNPGTPFINARLHSQAEKR